MTSGSLYQRLDDGGSEKYEIRLIEIISATDTKNIQCSLSTVDLADELRYIALSYVWGPQGETEDIIVNGRALKISANLAAALVDIKAYWNRKCPLRDPNSFRLWVDAICINQGDIPERNSQVQQMKEIYSTAESVISWLGRENVDVHLAFDIFRVISKETGSERVGGCTGYKYEDDKTATLWLEPYTTLTKWPKIQGVQSPWSAVVRFSEIPYWHRVWIFQEVALGSRIVYLCGDQSLNEAELNASATWFFKLKTIYEYSPQEAPRSMDADTWEYVFSEVLNCLSHPHRMRLLMDILDPDGTLSPLDDEDHTEGLMDIDTKLNHWDLFTYCSNLGTTEKRDYVYAVLGLTNCNIKVDYELKESTVFQKFVQSWISENNSLDVLRFAGTGYSDFDVTQPSWIPTYLYGPNSRNIDHFPRGEADMIDFQDTEQPLIDEGTLLVTGFLGTFITKVQAASLEQSITTGAFSEFVRSFLSRNTRYETGIHPLNAFFQVLMQRRLDLLRSLMYQRYGENDSFNDYLYPDLDGYRQIMLMKALWFLRDWLQFPSNETKIDWEKMGITTTNDLKTSLESIFPSETERLCQSDKCTEARKANVIHHESTEIGRLNVKTVMRLDDGMHRLAEMDRGFLGLVPKGARVGDLICIIKGCSVPVVLRKITDYYIHVGPCFVLGFVNQIAKLAEEGYMESERLQIK
jgi:Heterokaryon incompatibility protein (HET)